MTNPKFRAWEPKSKRLGIISNLYGDYGGFYTCAIYFLNSKTTIWGDGKITGKIEDFVLMQYTGLKDKNNKEIYDGDLVKFRGEEKLYEVLPYENGWQGAICRGYNADGSDLTISCAQLDHSETEVIGNKYENPDLLR